jgi:hypothetical protein
VIRDFLGQAAFDEIGLVKPAEEDGQQVLVTVIVPEFVLGQVLTVRKVMSVGVEFFYALSEVDQRLARRIRV